MRNEGVVFGHIRPVTIQSCYQELHTLHRHLANPYKSFPTIMGNCVKCLMILMPNGVFIYLYSQSIRLNILRWGLHHPSGRCLGGSARECSSFWWLDSRHVKTNRVDQSGSEWIRVDGWETYSMCFMMFHVFLTFRLRCSNTFCGTWNPRWYMIYLLKLARDFLLPLPCPCDFVSTYALLRWMHCSGTAPGTAVANDSAGAGFPTAAPRCWGAELRCRSQLLPGWSYKWVKTCQNPASWLIE